MNTAGIYLRYKHYFAFAFGPNRHSGNLGIVRFGGHIEHGESPVQCAIREAKEETNRDVVLLPSTRSFYLESTAGSSELILSPYIQEEPLHEVDPILVSLHNVMFWARVFEEPELSGETKGIILLSDQEIMKLCEPDTSYTYREFQDWGGRSTTRRPYPEHLKLEPFIQLRFLAWLLKAHPDLVHEVFAQ